MKVMCQKCGCHFKEDLKKTYKCGYWERIGLDSLSKKNKKVVWEWIFSLPQDQIYGEDKVEIGFSLFGKKVDGPKNKVDNQFARKVDGYKDWSEAERKEFQREYFKFMHNVTQDEQADFMLKLFLNSRENNK